MFVHSNIWMGVVFHQDCRCCSTCNNWQLDWVKCHLNKLYSIENYGGWIRASWQLDCNNIQEYSVLFLRYTARTLDNACKTHQITYLRIEKAIDLHSSTFFLNFSSTRMQTHILIIVFPFAPLSKNFPYTFISNCCHWYTYIVLPLCTVFDIPYSSILCWFLLHSLIVLCEILKILEASCCVGDWQVSVLGLDDGEETPRLISFVIGSKWVLVFVLTSCPLVLVLDPESTLDFNHLGFVWFAGFSRFL